MCRMKLFQERSKSFSEKATASRSDELAFDRGVEHPLLTVVREICAVAHSLAIFFCGHRHSCRISLHFTCNAVHVGTAVPVVVRKLEMSEKLV